MRRRRHGQFHSTQPDKPLENRFPLCRPLVVGDKRFGQAKEAALPKPSGWRWIDFLTICFYSNNIFGGELFLASRL
jgi:hypothetical protein